MLLWPGGLVTCWDSICAYGSCTGEASLSKCNQLTINSMNVSRMIFTALLGGALSTGLQAQDTGRALPLNPDVKTGTLDNGLTYYIQQNEKPDNQEDIPQVVNTGPARERHPNKGRETLS